MKKSASGYAVKNSDCGKVETEIPELNEMLQKVDRLLAEFYEIHGPHIKDQGHNP